MSVQFAKERVTPGSRESRALAGYLREEAARLGFARVAIADPRQSPDPAVMAGWLRAGYSAGLEYLTRCAAARSDPAQFLSGVQAIVCLAHDYYSEVRASGDPRVARYAWTIDYHIVLREKLHALRRAIVQAVPYVRARIAVDAGPVLERYWAARSGLGWIGRNGCLIVPRLGSWVFLAEIFIDLPLPFGAPLPSRCGRCRRCIEACPSSALIERPDLGLPACLDANRCLAYWTIEHRGPFTQATPATRPWIFGCDICQEVCPWNRFGRETQEPAFRAHDDWLTWSWAEWDRLDADAFRTRFARSPLWRVGYEGLRRNLAAARGSDSPGSA